jgi:hypothetical protein
MDLHLYCLNSHWGWAQVLAAMLPARLCQRHAITLTYVACTFHSEDEMSAIVNCSLQWQQPEHMY